MMRKIFLTALVACILIISGCATKEGYEKVVRSWIGSSEIELVRNWGPPTQAYETGGSKFLVYDNQGQLYIPGQAPTYHTTYYPYLGTATTQAFGGTPPLLVPTRCTTVFETKDSQIVDYRFEGNKCKA
jgi:hypothetical protein